jgi:hypothetical protein
VKTQPDFDLWWQILEAVSKDRSNPCPVQDFLFESKNAEILMHQGLQNSLETAS